MFKLFRKKHLTRATPSEVIDEIINKYIGPQLKDEGFRKVGRTWIREFDDYSFIINVQASRWNGRETGASFVVNYGVYVPAIYELLFGTQRPKSPKPYDCMLDRRLSDGRKGEIWWEIYDHTDTTKLGLKVSTAVHEQCGGLFNQIRSLSDVARTLEEDEGTSLGLLSTALLCVELDDRKKAKEYFLLAIRDSSDNEPFQAKVISVAKECEFDLNC